MRHIKVINEATELVPMLMALNTPVKRDVFDEIVRDWHTLSEIEERYGPEGRDALLFFEKAKLVDTQWQINDNKQKEKAYRSYYNSYHIQASCPISEISDILTVAIMGDDEFEKYENDIVEAVKAANGEMYVGELLEALNISDTMLKSIIKRSSVLDYRGLRVGYFNPED